MWLVLVFCATIPAALFGSIKSRDPMLFLRGQRVNSKYILPATTALARGESVPSLKPLIVKSFLHPNLVSSCPLQ